MLIKSVSPNIDDLYHLHAIVNRTEIQKKTLLWNREEFRGSDRSYESHWGQTFQSQWGHWWCAWSLNFKISKIVDEHASWQANPDTRHNLVIKKDAHFLETMHVAIYLWVMKILISIWWMGHFHNGSRQHTNNNHAWHGWMMLMDRVLTRGGEFSICSYPAETSPHPHAFQFQYFLSFFLSNTFAYNLTQKYTTQYYTYIRIDIYLYTLVIWKQKWFGHNTTNRSMQKMCL